MDVNTAIASLMISVLLLPSVVGADPQGLLSSWEVSVDFIPPNVEHIGVFLNVENTGTVAISGLQLSLISDSLEYVEDEGLSFDEEESSEKLEVTIEKADNANLITIKLPRPLQPNDATQMMLNFNSKGLLVRQGGGYIAKIKFREPMIMLESGENAPLDIDTGSVRVHTPEGYIYTEHTPDPWRYIWQGVSGFNAHYILIFNGGTQFDEPITVTFKESPVVKRAVELYKDLKEQEASQAKPQEDLDNANRHITNGANYVITGNEGLAVSELNEAESILTGEPMEKIISDQIKPVDIEEAAPIKGIYIIGASLAVLIIVLVVFGKNIISALKGGRTDE